MSYGVNGGVIGPENAPTSSAASGVWSLGEVAEAMRDDSWPGPPKGYVLLWGDPDNAGGVAAESYPYDMEFEADNTTVRVGGRWNTSTSNTQRIASGALDLSGGWGGPPTSTTGQNSWNFTHNSPTYQGIYNHAGAMWIDGSDNMYQCGHSYDASYGYYNVGIVKENSSQAVQWNVIYKSSAGTPYGFRDGAIWKSETSGYVGMIGTVYGNRNGANKQRQQMLGLSDSDGSVTHSKIGKSNSDTVNTSQTNGASMRSNMQGDKFATAVGYATASSGQWIDVMLWTAEVNNFQEQWTVGGSAIRSNSSGGNAIYATGICQDSSNNVYVASNFGATAISGSYTPTNTAITKYNSSGAYQWTYVLRQQAGGEETSLTSGGIAISADGDDLFISAYSEKVGGSTAAPVIARLDVSGATPSLTWITQFASATYSCYSQNLKLIGTDTVLSFGYGQTDPTANVLGVLVAANQDGTTLGSGVVDGIAWTATDISGYIVFANGASGGTANVAIQEETSTGFTWGAGNETTTGSTPTWINGATSPTIQVESGGIG